MLKYLFSFLFVILCCTSSKVSAQQYTGCLLPNGKLHYVQNGTHGGKTNYKKNPNVNSGSVFCIAVVTNNPNCKVDKKNNPQNQGTKRTFYMVQCPIDDYVPLIILLIGGFAFYTIRGLNPKTA